MIKLDMTIQSATLLRPVRVLAVVPHGLTVRNNSYRAIWMLHAAMSDSSMFTDSARLLDFIDDKELAFIAPCLGNGYFVDSPYEKQSTFLKYELFPAIQQLLPVSKEKNDNFLLGVSMGGYGAIRWAMDTPDMFSAAASISGGFGLDIPVDERVKKSRELRPIYQLFVKDIMPKRLLDETGNIRPQADIRALTKKAAGSGAISKIGLFCGESDYLCIGQNHGFYRYCESLGIDAELFIAQGSHNREYWDIVLPQAVEWLMTEIK